MPGRSHLDSSCQPRRAQVGHRSTSPVGLPDVLGELNKAFGPCWLEWDLNCLAHMPWEFRHLHSLVMSWSLPKFLTGLWRYQRWCCVHSSLQLVLGAHEMLPISSDGSRNSGCRKQPGATSREVKLLKGTCWAGLEPRGHFFPGDDIAETVEYVAEKEKLLLVVLTTNSSEGRKTLTMDSTRDVRKKQGRSNFMDLLNCISSLTKPFQRTACEWSTPHRNRLKCVFYHAGPAAFSWTVSKDKERCYTPFWTCVVTPANANAPRQPDILNLHHKKPSLPQICLLPTRQTRVLW